MAALSIPLGQQAAAINAAIATYSVPAQVFMGMYNNETSLGTNVSTSSASAFGPFQFIPSTAHAYGYPLTNTPTLSEFQQQAHAAAHLLSDEFKRFHNWKDALQLGYYGGTSPDSTYGARAMAFQIPANWRAALKDPAKAGGTVGSGGTGSLLNAAANQQANFQVGDPLNPDEDYWSAINRLAQARYWYAFSDGETLFLADGPDLMKQVPAMEIDRIGDGGQISHFQMTFDNTAFQYSVDHKKRKRTQRRTHLAKVTSPVEAQLNVVCKVDEVRAGDVVSMSSCGPGDGNWLVGDCRRSVFQVASEVDMVVALQPLTEAEILSPAGVNSKNSALLPGLSGGSGSYVNPFRRATGFSIGRTDMGVDACMTPGSPIVAPGDSKIVGWIPTWFQGQPLVVGELLQPVKRPLKGAGKFWYLAEQIKIQVHQGDTVRAGQLVATFAPSGSCIEMGWAADASGRTLAQATTGYSEGQQTAAGKDFRAWLKTLGVAGA